MSFHSSIDDEFASGLQKMENMTELERTIYTMEQSQICADPKHCHSFQTVNFMISALRKCAACDTRMQTVVFASNDSTKQIVKCAACGAFAHRSCASSRHSRWKEACPVNKQLIEAAIMGDSKDLNSDQNDSTTSGEIVRNPSMGSWNEEEDGESKHEAESEVISDEPPLSMEWTTEGPPQHWASGDPKSMVSTITIPSSVDKASGDDADDEVHITALHHADHPFASVSRALQENILAHFRPRNQAETETGASEENKPIHELADSAPTTSEVLSVKAKRTKEKEDENNGPNTLSKIAQAVRTTVSLPSRMGMATFAGGIAGGVAGLAMAGPAGAYAGYRLGEAAGVLGVILEGSVSIGVIVASVATASYTANKIHDHMEERRVLTMGEEGTSRKVLLVRPNIKVDPAWDAFCEEAKRSAPKSTGGKLFFLSDDSCATRERYLRDKDIVQPSEVEISTPEKVLLLASRILNDKNSVPGHVYRSLIKKFCDRCAEPISQTDDAPTRRRRDDAHAVIKHVTATLLEERPGFGQTAVVTELTATAVEGFVFGKIYSLVFEEVQQEVAQKDADLMEKITTFERTQSDFASLVDQISEDALQALAMLPTSHTAVEKLNFCTAFLERISEHFSKTSGNSADLCADSLLKMVCQHIIVAKVLFINAEVAFLEEFARDEQLLRGKEGYALVTLQAALHFLNLSSDFEDDIFEQENDEKNVPVEPISGSTETHEGTTTRSSGRLGESGELL